MPDSAFDSQLRLILTKSFDHPHVVHRLLAEIKDLIDLDPLHQKVFVQSSQLGLKVKIELSKVFFKQFYPAFQEELLPEPHFKFEILLGKAYPSSSVSILCKSEIRAPSLNDGRNLLLAVMSEWADSFSLSDILNNIPIFLKNYLSQEESVGQLGTYSVEALYSLQDFKGMKSVRVFKVAEHLSQTKQQSRVVVVSEEHFLTLEQTSSAHLLRLLSWTNLRALLQIKRKVLYFQKEQQHLELTWQAQQGRVTQLLTPLDNQQFLDLVVNRVAALGCAYSRSVEPSSYSS